MRESTCARAVVLASALALGACATTKGAVQPATPSADVTSAAHGFTVHFPDTPQATIEKQPDGTTVVERWRLDGVLPTSSLSLIVEVRPLPDPRVDAAAELQRLMAEMRAPAARVLVDAPVKVASVDGHELLLAVEGGYTHGRWFLREGKEYRVYGLVGLGPEPTKDAEKQGLEAVDAFLKSFRFTR
jgi:hypothetical protein